MTPDQKVLPGGRVIPNNCEWNSTPTFFALRQTDLYSTFFGDVDTRGSQTLYPMDRNQCLILTNLEYAKKPITDTLQKRTFARNYRQLITKIDAVIRERTLTAQEITNINFIITKRARRFIGGGHKNGCARKRP
ncbi:MULTISPECIES: hypothetical protein [unclassified Roseibium]|uniref:hypothetical protein n=1 Tax=unclassified Roseibium TaxID=2629323 RepID=UPI00273E9E43|nr:MULTISPECIES: hypothetical protein [unclassified Roseibium]